MAVGIDHPIATMDAEVREDSAFCPVFNSRPNHVFGQTGAGSALYPGMVDGTSHYLSGSRPGRLARGSNRIVVESGSPSLDNTPLWNYLNGAGPGSCGSVGTTAEMATCISEYRSSGSTTAIFDLSVGDAVRFGAVPQLDANSWLPGRQRYGIVNILPVYVQGTFWKCTGVSCDIIHYPGDAAASSGVGTSVNGANRLSGVTAFVLDLNMLPEPLRSNFPSTAEQVDYALVK